MIEVKQDGYLTVNVVKDEGKTTFRRPVLLYDNLCDEYCARLAVGYSDASGGGWNPCTPLNDSYGGGLSKDLDSFAPVIAKGYAAKLLVVWKGVHITRSGKKIFLWSDTIKVERKEFTKDYFGERIITSLHNRSIEDIDIIAENYYNSCYRFFMEHDEDYAATQYDEEERKVVVKGWLEELYQKEKEWWQWTLENDWSGENADCNYRISDLTPFIDNYLDFLKSRETWFDFVELLKWNEDNAKELFRILQGINKEKQNDAEVVRTIMRWREYGNKIRYNNSSDNAKLREILTKMGIYHSTSTAWNNAMNKFRSIKE